jgi:hypothetical protein
VLCEFHASLLNSVEIRCSGVVSSQKGRNNKRI